MRRTLILDTETTGLGAAVQDAGARLANRFWRRIRKSDGCWEWTGAVGGHGYGVIGIGAREAGTTTTHRLSWLLAFGSIPDGQCVLHRCDNRRCVRPDHLFLGTRSDNVVDMDAKGRRRTAVICGSAHRNAKLDETTATLIRERHARGDCTYDELARDHNVSKATIASVVSRRSWRHAA